MNTNTALHLAAKRERLALTALVALSFLLPLLHYSFLWQPFKGMRWFAELAFAFSFALAGALACSWWQPSWTRRLLTGCVLAFLVFTFIYACYVMLALSAVGAFVGNHAAS